MLPPDQEKEFRGLWEEFEAKETPEARFAGVFDRLEPLLQNYKTGGVSWNEHGVTAPMVKAKNGVIADGSKVLWDYALGLINESIRGGYLKDE